jgi:16S rRNA (cytidine1402-2'-O)-methyltransferase
MVPRALEVLKAVDIVAAEDTRHSARLFRHFGIESRLVAYHDHNESEQSNWLAAELRAGRDVALVTDAGTPLISDPGYRLVAVAQAAGVQVIPVPGPCALVAALSVSGLPSDRFVFEGFLPHREAARKTRLAELAGERRTLILYESPHRVLDSLQDMVIAFGPGREAVLARELTKAFETVRRLPLGQLLDWVRADPDQQRGEFVLLVAGCSGDEVGLTPEVVRVAKLLVAELPASRAAALAARITGAGRQEIYRWLQDNP